mgnify:CR=1 FL=1
MLINILISVGILVLVAVLAALLLAVAEHYLQVNDDNELHVDKIEFYLPSYNCGACGHVNCKEVAKAIVDGKIKDVSVCKVITEDNARLIREYCKENNIEIK